MTGLFPPGKGGGEEVEPVRCVFSPRCSTWRAYGGKGKGILIHTLTEGNGMPLANSTTPANGNEREQVLPLLDKVKLKTLKRGFLHVNDSRCWLRSKGYDSKQQRASLRKRGIRPQIPKRVWKTKKNTRLTDQNLGS
ncbi:MAG: transposase [Tolypothrix carrinoi HA7290-LM1]|nr:transposase [Tolypothrix carrinoi HA7290-LM1]